MTRAAPIVVAGESFATHAALKKRVQLILGGPPGNLDGYHYHFVRDLLDRHPQAVSKIGPGVHAIRIAVNLPYRTKGFWVEREDGTVTDFSYLECLKPESQATKFRKACRTAVVEQVRQAGANIPPRCPITDEPLGPGNAHVDHAPPWTFEALVRAYVNLRGIDVEAVDLNADVDGDVIQRFADQAIADDFAAFHAEYATLRVVSIRANLSTLRKRS